MFSILLAVALLLLVVTFAAASEDAPLKCQPRGIPGT
jgi:hypothetical protein